MVYRQSLPPPLTRTKGKMTFIKLISKILKYAFQSDIFNPVIPLSTTVQLSGFVVYAFLVVVLDETIKPCLEE